MKPKRTIQKDCIICGKLFFTSKWDIEHGGGKCCSRSCSGKLKHQLHSQQGASNPFWKNGKSRDAYNSYTKKYKQNNPEKIKAHQIVLRAIRSGKLIPQPCEICGALKVDAHHDDYNIPLSVRWLCRKHHNKLSSLPRTQHI